MTRLKQVCLECSYLARFLPYHFGIHLNLPLEVLYSTRPKNSMSIFHHLFTILLFTVLVLLASAEPGYGVLPLLSSFEDATTSFDTSSINGNTLFARQRLQCPPCAAFPGYCCPLGSDVSSLQIQTRDSSLHYSAPPPLAQGETVSPFAIRIQDFSDHLVPQGAVRPKHRPAEELNAAFQGM